MPDGGLRRPLRCAIYTRKSTEEGLEQDFNSLDAQREACAAYILSQRHEGWTLVPDHYDDGGYSGGTMERPALKLLLAELAAGRVDIIVVYKVDRLTRSLADFAKIVDVLDKSGASFVSVTQSFNTTSSMGRLTLNVLLSFAQFEREVTSERIRDKLAASKAKGMWMGGPIPLGYRLGERKLLVDEQEAETVRHIFRRYLELQSAIQLVKELELTGIRSKPRINRFGRDYGNAKIGRGALYTLLQNHLYVGEVAYKGQIYPGQHDAIIDRATFEAAQQMLAQARVDRRLGTNAKEPSLLAGLMWDGHGRRLTPTHSSRQNRRYRYYISQTDDVSVADPAWRVSAPDIEGLAIDRIRAMLTDTTEQAVASGSLDGDTIGQLNNRVAGMLTRLDSLVEQRGLLLQLIERIDILGETVRIEADFRSVHAALSGRHFHEHTIGFVRSGQQVKLIIPPAAASATTNRSPSLLKLIAQAFTARREMECGGSIEEVAGRLGYGREYVADLIRTSYLSPTIITAIIHGTQPASLTRRQLVRADRIPLSWTQQERLFGFA